MEKLFENITTYSPSEYKKFSAFHIKKYDFSYRFYTLFFEMLFLFCCIAQFSYGNIDLGIFFIIIMIIFICWRLFYPYFFNKKEASSDKITKKLKNTFSFYNHYIKISNAKGNFTFYYFKLYKVYETNKNYYLYINNTYAFLISKEGFCIGTDDEFSKFIKKKTSYKYKKE